MSDLPKFPEKLSVELPRLDLLPGEIRTIDDTEKDDIFLAGYPKSGNTWCQTCMAAIVYGIDIRRSSNQLVQTLIPDVHFRSRRYLRIRSPMCLKTHALPKPNYRRAVYILRDGRDAMTSFHRFLGDPRNRPRSLRGPRENDWNWMLRHGCFASISWHEHVRTWQENPYGAEVLTIRFEDMKSDPVRVLGQMAEFAGIKQTRAQLEWISEMTSFPSMKKRENRFAAEQPRPREIVRRGTIGSYKDEMPQKILKRFEEMAGETLREMGYAA